MIASSAMRTERVERPRTRSPARVASGQKSLFDECSLVTRAFDGQFRYYEAGQEFQGFARRRRQDRARTLCELTL